MLLHSSAPSSSSRIIFGVPWLTFVICRCLPGGHLRLATCLILTIAPVALLHVYFTYGYALRRTPGLENLPTIIGWGVIFSPFMAFGAFLSMFPNWVVDRMLYGLASICTFGRPSYYDRHRHWD